MESFNIWLFLLPAMNFRLAQIEPVPDFTTRSDVFML